MPLLELPVGLPGKVFKSPMPFGDWDREGHLIQDYHGAKVSVIVVLAEDQECVAKAGRSLRDLYEREGFEVIPMPIRDFSIPARHDLETAVDAAMHRVRAGANVVVHCNAGIGRTGMFLAAFRKRAEGCTGGEAVAWIRQYIPNAVETPEQRQLVCECFGAEWAHDREWRVCDASGRLDDATYGSLPQVVGPAGAGLFRSTEEPGMESRQTRVPGKSV